MDDRTIEAGDLISETLIKAIQESRIGLVVFSPDYASSTHCLNELANIIDLSIDQNRMFFLPVFYEVEPTILRHQKGSYEEALIKHEVRFGKQKINEWKAVLEKAAGVSGFTSNKYRYDSDLISDIVQSVTKKISKFREGEKNQRIYNVDDENIARQDRVPRGAAASVCFKTGLAHLELNHLSDALSCFDESFLALAKEQSRGSDDIKAQATICAQYKTAVTLLREIGRLQRVHDGPSAAMSAKDEMARLSRHLGSLPLLAKHRINCIRTAIKRNMEVQNYAYSKQMLELLLSKVPPSKQEELRSLVDLCVQRGLTNNSIDPLEDPSQFCAATLTRLSTIGYYDVCDLCGAKFSAVTAHLAQCIVCGMGSKHQKI